MSAIHSTSPVESCLRTSTNSISQHVYGENHPLLPDMPNIHRTYGNEFVEADRKAQTLAEVRRKELMLLEAIKEERDPPIWRGAYGAQKPSSWWRTK